MKKKQATSLQNIKLIFIKLLTAETLRLFRGKLSISYAEYVTNLTHDVVRLNILKTPVKFIII